MGYRRKTVENTKKIARKLLRYEEAKEYYGLGRTKLTELAKEAHAILRVDGVVWIDIETMNEFLYTFRE